MRLKYYLRGAGIGIIVTTLILTIAFAFTKTNTMTDEEVAKRAQEMGYVLASDTLDDSSDDTSKDENDDETATEETTTDSTSDTTAEEKQQDLIDQTIDENTKEATDTTVSYVAFTVSPGQSSNAVAQNLYEAGLVDDADAFNEYMNGLGVDNLIQSGTFYLSSDASYDDIVAILVTKQENRDTTPPAAE